MRYVVLLLLLGCSNVKYKVERSINPQSPLPECSYKVTMSDMRFSEEPDPSSKHVFVCGWANGLFQCVTYTEFTKAVELENRKYEPEEPSDPDLSEDKSQRRVL